MLLSLLKKKTLTKNNKFVFFGTNAGITRIEVEVMAAGTTTKERLERLINAKKQLEAQINRNGQILAAVSKFACSSGDTLHPG